MMRTAMLAAALFVCLAACTGDGDYGACDIDCPSGSRTGAQCSDGTDSDATGSGACSGHDGVKCWYCSGS